MIQKKVLLLLFVVIFFLSGCGWWKDLWHRPERTRATPEGLYQRGIDAYQAGRYKNAIESFQRLREEHPLHSLTIMAELGIADSYFSDETYAEAEIAYNDFVNLRPTNENLPYAMYQLGMCHYKQVFSIDRDQTETKKAKKAFERLIARFPNSKFSFLAEKTLRECNQMLAEHEFYVGEFYFKRKHYNAALKRFEGIIKDYANVGLDYKVSYFIAETKRRIAEEDARKTSSKDKK
jgi:outer membrane protein assembly factor BamD